MKTITRLMISFLLFSAFGACSGAVLFEGYNPQEPREIRLNMQHIEKPKENTPTSRPVCYLILSETEPGLVNLTIIVSTAALHYQTENFETWLSINSQEPEKISGILDSHGSRLGQLYSRQYYVPLRGLEEDVYFIKVRVAGDYYHPYPEGGNYDCEGNVSFIIDNTFPTIDNISIENATYFQNDLELACTTSEPCSWIAYSLDNQTNVTIKTADNRTNEIQQAKTNLTDMLEGSHTLTIYASDTAGNIGASQTITFTVDKSRPYPETIIIASALAVVVIVVAVFLLVRRGRHRKH